MEWTEEDLMKLAEMIGGKVERGELPPQDEFGRYIFPKEPML